MALYTKQVKIGNLAIGNGNPIAIQSMLNIPANDVEGNVKQAIELQKAGCEIIRTAAPDLESVRLIDALKNAVNIPKNCCQAIILRAFRCLNKNANGVV